MTLSIAGKTTQLSYYASSVSNCFFFNQSYRLLAICDLEWTEAQPLHYVQFMYFKNYEY